MYYLSYKAYPKKAQLSNCLSTIGRFDKAKINFFIFILYPSALFWFARTSTPNETTQSHSIALHFSLKVWHCYAACAPKPPDNC
jgi:hypothetical protein